MATLEKIRSKSVFLIVVIGVALLAFIVGDAITNGRNIFGSGSTVAKIGDTKVDISEYQNRLTQLQEANPDADAQELSQAVIDMLLNEKLLDQAAADMGIQVSDEQVTYYILENPLQPMQEYMQTYGRAIQQMYPDAQLTPTLVYNVVFNPQKYGLTNDQVANLKAAWLQMEKETKQAAARNIYLTLLQSTLQPNNLDKQALFAQNNDSYTVDVARKSFGELDAKKYPVSDAELQAEYDKRKNYYKVNEPTKTVGFIAYNIRPSQADIAAAKKLQATTLASVKAGKPLSKDAQKEGVRFDKRKVTALAAPDAQIGAFLKTATIDSVKVFDRGGSFHIVKVTATELANDSVELAVLQVMKEQVPAVTKDLKAGLALDSVAARYADKVQTNPAQWLSVQNEQVRSQLAGMNSTVAAALDTVASGALLTLQEGDQGSLLAYVKDVKPRVTVYEYDDTYYDLYPSTDTVDAATLALSKYAEKNNTPAKFAEGAQAAGYQYQSMPVSASTPAFPMGYNPMTQSRSYYPKSRDIVEWAVTAGEPGSVSEVFNNEDNQNPIIYIAMVEDEYDEYAPYTDTNVKKDLENRIRARKAGDAMVKQFSGKGSLAATAQAMGVPVVTDNQVRFAGSMNIPEPVVAARATASKPGVLKLAKGQNGVYAYVLKAKNPNTTQYFDQQQDQAYKQAFITNAALVNMLRGDQRIENNIFKLTRSK